MADATDLAAVKEAFVRHLATDYGLDFVGCSGGHVLTDGQILRPMIAEQTTSVRPPTREFEVIQICDCVTSNIYSVS